MATQQYRNTVVSSVSFDPEVFEKMENYLKKTHMSRSEYLNLLVRADAKRKGPLVVPEDEVEEVREPKYPVGLLPNVDAADVSRGRRSKGK